MDQVGGHRRRVVVGMLVVLTCVLGLALSACGGGGGSDSGGTTAAKAPEGGGSTVDLQAVAEKKVAEFEAEPSDWPGPTEPFKPGTGKAMVIACGLAAEGCAVNSKEAADAVKAMGWESSEVMDGEFSPSKQSAYVEQATQEGYTGIVLVTIEVPTIKAAVERAVNAGLVVVCSLCESGPEWEGKVIDTTNKYTRQGEELAWGVLARSGEEAKVVHFVDNAFLATRERWQGFEETFTKACPSCSIEKREFATADVAKPGPPEFTALLSTDPPGTVTDVIGQYDGAAIPMAKTAEQQGREDILVWGYDGEEAAVNALADGNPPYGGTAGIPYAYMTWAAVDLMGRKKAGVELWEDPKDMPVQLITSKNASQFLNPYSDPAPEGNWRGNFEKLWEK